jgi:hypothetical protein
MTSGGKRKGAGRKPSKRKTVWVRVDAELARVLHGMPADERAEFLNEAIREAIRKQVIR